MLSHLMVLTEFVRLVLSLCTLAEDTVGPTKDFEASQWGTFDTC
jgi:hypothetical protein